VGEAARILVEMRFEPASCVLALAAIAASGIVLVERRR
jgi:hypothetical protein